MRTLGVGNRMALGLCVLALSTLAGCAHRTRPVGVAAAPPHAPLPASVGDGRRFAQPKDALNALVAACAAGDDAAVIAIFGDSARTLVSTGRPAADAERCRRLVAAARAMSRIDHAAPGAVTIVLGHDDWVLPIPLVQTTSGWQFDIAAGRDEVRRRHVGANELEAIRVCRAYAVAQAEYAESTGGRHALRFASTRGRRDGLGWTGGHGRDASPLGPNVARALQDSSWAGYRYRILPPARRGAAPTMIATPVAYGSSGIASFLVTADGRVLERDLGAGADPAAGAAGTDGWTPVAK